MTRGALLAAFTMMLAGPLAARAQVSDVDYKARREQLAKELAATQKALAEVKGQRAQLQARVESLIAQAMQERAARANSAAAGQSAPAAAGGETH